MGAAVRRGAPWAAVGTDDLGGGRFRKSGFGGGRVYLGEEGGVMGAPARAKRKGVSGL